MESTTIIVVALPLVALIMVAGGLWLLHTQKIHLDETTKASVIITPFGRFKTNTPALMFFALALVPLLVDSYLSLNSFVRVATVRGSVDSRVYPVIIYAAVRSESVQAPIGEKGSFVISVPCYKDPDFNPKIVYIAGSTWVADPVELKQEKCGEVNLREKKISPAIDTANFAPQGSPRPKGY